jgi:biopolymer transport protein ExbB
MSIVALAVVLLKLAQFVGTGVGRGRGIQAALGLWFQRDGENAVSHLSRFHSPAAICLRHAMMGLAKGLPERTVREDSERVALEQLAGLRSFLRILESTAQIAPLLGLFGTVIGMMQAFQALQAAGAASDPTALAGGIWVALITTAVGLAVAIPASFVLFWFEGRIEREKCVMEGALTSLFTCRLEEITPRRADHRESGKYSYELANAAE